MPTNCVSCHNTALSKIEEKWSYSLYACASCKFQFWFPFKTPGNEYYEHSVRFQIRNAHPESKKLYESQRLFLQDNPKPGSVLLDLGMGSGRFLSSAKQKGYRVTGTDFDTTSAVSAKKYFGIDDVHAYDLDTFFEKYPQRKFDIITIFGVLEHLDSFAFMRRIVPALIQGGVFVIDVPNRDCWPRHLDHEGPPLHLTRWNVESMRRFLEQYGLKIELVKKLRLPFRLVISQFNKWSHGVVSFDVVRRIEEGTTQTGKVRGRTLFSRILRLLSMIKTYVLFFIPAGILYLWLWVTGQLYTELYFIATPVSSSHT